MKGQVYPKICRSIYLSSMDFFYIIRQHFGIYRHDPWIYGSRGGVVLAVLLLWKLSFGLGR